jgi:hypothetical protein
MFEDGVHGRTHSQLSGKRQLQAKILSDTMALDCERALFAMKEWGIFIETSSGRQHHKDFANMEEYLLCRCKDVGYMYNFSSLPCKCLIIIVSSTH